MEGFGMILGPEQMRTMCVCVCVCVCVWLCKWLHSWSCPCVLQFLLLIFSCLRKAAWDYGRLALLMENDRWIHHSLSYAKNLSQLWVCEPRQRLRWWSKSQWALSWVLIQRPPPPSAEYKWYCVGRRIVLGASTQPIYLASSLEK